MFLTNCQKDDAITGDDKIPKTEQSQDAFEFKQISFTDLYKDQKFKKAYLGFTSQKGLNLSKSLADPINQFTIDSTSIKQIDYRENTTYTMFIRREKENDGYFENLVLKVDSLQNTEAYIIKYNLNSPLEYYPEHKSYNVDADVEVTRIDYNKVKGGVLSRSTCVGVYELMCNGTLGNGCTGGWHTPGPNCQCIVIKEVGLDCSTEGGTSGGDDLPSGGGGGGGSGDPNDGVITAPNTEPYTWELKNFTSGVLNSEERAYYNSNTNIKNNINRFLIAKNFDSMAEFDAKASLGLGKKLSLNYIAFNWGFNNSNGIFKSTQLFLAQYNNSTEAIAFVKSMVELDFYLDSSTSIINTRQYPEEIKPCCPGDCCPDQSIYANDHIILMQYGVEIVHDAIDGTFNIFVSATELIGSDKWVGSRIRIIMGEVGGLEIPTDVTDQQLAEIFQVRKRSGSLVVEYRPGVIKSLIDLGLDTLDVLAILSPSKGGGAFLAVRGGGKIAVSVLSDYLKLLSKGSWQTVSESMSDAAKSYQEFITGRKWNESFVLNTIKFDGLKDGVLSDAKSGHLNFVDFVTGEFKSWWATSESGGKEMIRQAQRQLTAANGVPIEWHFEHQSVRDAAEKLFEGRDFNIILKHTPR